ncbi:DUF2058 domain-containing protein [Cellvibrio polysaccharolyticus]|uniref:DUF2058 domain-containing protein n=1 Tax=Cellvibrio polysaccharolyticus TaxID=2082724 RepID=A0A928V1X9_9GAMM|nr:DUF2058 domain-containing protein [Cellvibrio polysaccharolyticus]MBE8717280.1 DUF2058 domain-containing protein [Cellvibrio polysaccharolyticus]
MASLQDQLLKAGLIDKKQAKQVNKEKRKQDNVARRSADGPVDEVKVQAELTRQQKVERDRELNRKRDEELQQKAVAAQIRQLIENHRQPKGDGEQEFHFTDSKFIKKIRVSGLVLQQINRGQLVVARLGDNYELVPKVVADKIAQRDEKAIIPLAKPVETSVDEDDPYKDYVIPDDLMW